MREMLNLDDELIATARELTGEHETGPLVEAALTALIQRESARRLARLGSAFPAIRPAPRRRGLSA